MKSCQATPIRLLALLAVLILSSVPAYAGPIVSWWELRLSARNRPPDDASAVDHTGALPFSLSHTASTLAGTTGTASYDFTTNGDGALFQFNFDLYRSGALESGAQAGGHIEFQVTSESRPPDMARFDHDTF